MTKMTEIHVVDVKIKTSPTEIYESANNRCTTTVSGGICNIKSAVGLEFGVQDSYFNNM